LRWKETNERTRMACGCVSIENKSASKTCPRESLIDALWSAREYPPLLLSEQKSRLSVAVLCTRDIFTQSAPVVENISLKIRLVSIRIRAVYRARARPATDDDRGRASLIAHTSPHEGTAVVAMASRAMSLSGFARRAVHRACPGLATFARPYAANVATVSEEDSFLKWTTPEPQQFTHQSILAAPVTKVRRDSRAARAPRGSVVRAEAPRSPARVTARVARTRRADPIDRARPDRQPSSKTNPRHAGSSSQTVFRMNVRLTSHTHSCPKNRKNENNNR
jgi:hypothetical protein